MPEQQQNNQNLGHYKQFLDLFVTVEFRTSDGYLKSAKGLLVSVNESKLFIKGDYKRFLLDISQIINISGAKYVENNNHHKVVK